MPTLADSIDLFLKLPRSPSTAQNYRRCLEAFAVALGKDLDVSAITHATLIDYMAGVGQRVRASSADQYLRILKTFFNWLVRCGELAQSPARGLAAPKVQFDPDEVRAIPTDLLLKMKQLVRHKLRDYAMLLFFADSACRRGAVARLQRSRLNLADGKVVVQEKGGVFVEVYFGDETAAALAAWLKVRPAVDHDYVFTRNGPATPLKPESVSAIIRRLAIRAGDSYGPHSIRHWVAESWAEAGEMPNTVQHKLNHRHIASTLVYYPKHNRYVREASRRLSLGKIRDSKSTYPAYIIPLDDAG